MAQSDRSKNTPPTFVSYNIICGGIAGCVAKSIIAPIDRAKIIFQSTTLPFNTRKMFEFIVKTYKEEGFLRLWRGNTATLIRIFPYSSINYSSHEKYKHLFRIDSPYPLQMPLFELRLRRFVAGCCAGLTAVGFTYPLDFARSRMAITSSAKYKSLNHAIKTVYREEGFRTLYRGFIPGMIGTIPYCGIAYFTFETLKETHFDKKFDITGIRPNKLDPLYNLLYGGLAGVLGQTVSYPFDVVRRRMQNAGVTGHSEYCDSVIKTFRIVWTNEGLFHGLFKGVMVNWIKAPIASGISFTVFHQLQHLIHLYS